MSVEVIQTLPALRALCERLRGQARIGIDLEGDGLFRYRARLCTMQLRAGDEIVVVDTLAAWDPEAVAPLLGPGGPLKVIHDLGFDARLLRDSGVRLGNVFDTALAARFLGRAATGLGALVQDFCGVEIDKGPQQADWGLRPFSDAALGYLRADVEYLFTLHDALGAELEARGIVAEYDTELHYLLSQALQLPEPPGPPWRRIKGASDLDASGQAVLRELALVREEAARAADVPVFRILHDRVLLALAQRKPGNAAVLRKVRGADKGRAAALVPAWLQAVERGRQAGRVPEDESDAALRVPPPSPQERAQRKARHAALSAWRRTTAEARGVDLQVVLPGHCLQDLCGLAAVAEADLGAVAGLGQVRLARDGAAIAAVLADADAAAGSPS